MADQEKLKRPWMLAVWPGMGQVALSAGYYLMAKLGMHQIAEFPALGLFDVDYVAVKDGCILPSQRPRSRFFAWRNPYGERDIVVFIGEAQPPIGKYAFCEKLIDIARDFGVERMFTFAAMASDMHPEQEPKIFAAATNQEDLKELDRPEIYLLQEGHIGGLNGVALGAARDKGMPGICLLGEMPQLFAQVPFPRASLAVLRIFAEMAKIELDFKELEEQAQAMGKHLAQILGKLEQKLSAQAQVESSDEFEAFHPDERLSEEDHALIEDLFAQAEKDRSKAYLLKNELDRLEVFNDYEDRFLDLFKDQD